MCQEYLQGGPNNSIRKIAQRFNRDWETVSRIVRSEEMEEIAKKMKKAILANTAEKIVERIDYEVGTKKTKDGAWIAMDLAERLGAIPPKIQRTATVAQMHTTVEEVAEASDERVKAWVQKLTEITMERGRIFGMPMPELDEVRDDDIPITVEKVRRQKEKEHVDR